MRIARKRGITRCRSFTAGARAKASREAIASRSSERITCPAAQRMIATTAIQASMAMGMSRLRFHLEFWRSSRQLFRSEEHTSELQSQSNLVCRLLLEKKKLDCMLSRPPFKKVETLRRKYTR